MGVTCTCDSSAMGTGAAAVLAQLPSLSLCCSSLVEVTPEKSDKLAQILNELFIYLCLQLYPLRLCV